MNTLGKSVKAMWREANSFYESEAYEKSYELYKEIGDLTKEGEFYYYAGNAALQSGKIDISRECFEKSNTEESRVGLGHCFYREKAYGKAYEQYLECLRGDAYGSEDVGMHCFNAAVEGYLYDEAEMLCCEALEVNPGGHAAMAGELLKLWVVQERELEEIKQFVIKALESFRDVNELASGLDIFSQIGKAQFSGHYEFWREKRISVIRDYYKTGWFRGKRILELGCGFGDIGMRFVNEGGDCVFCEGRQEHLDEMKRRFPAYEAKKFICANLEDGLPELGDFDLVLHLGLLYHLENWKKSLGDMAKRTKYLVLETEVCDSDDLNAEVCVDERGYDQSLTGKAVRVSAAAIEKVLSDNGFEFERIKDNRCNSGLHCYDWEIENTLKYGPEYRRMWFCVVA